MPRMRYVDEFCDSDCSNGDFDSIIFIISSHCTNKKMMLTNGSREFEELDTKCRDMQVKVKKVFVMDSCNQITDAVAKGNDFKLDHRHCCWITCHEINENACVDRNMIATVYTSAAEILYRILKN